MSKHVPSTRAARSESIRGMALTAMFVAIILLMNLTPLGYLDLPLIKATLIHVPVIIGSILLGPRKGAFLGLVFGLTSLVKNTMTPSVLSFAFSPLIPVPGTEHGSPWALAVSLLTRVLVGAAPGLLYRGLRAVSRGRPGLRPVWLALCGAAGALINTGLVMGLIFVVFREAYAAAYGLALDAVLGVILGVVAGNGIPEAAAALVLTPMVCVPLIRGLKLELAPVPAQ